MALAMAVGHPRDPMPWIISGTDANPGLWEPRERQVPVPQAELGPSVAACLCPLSGFGCAQTLKGQSCSINGMAKQQQTLNSLKSPPASPHMSPRSRGAQLPLSRGAAVCSSTHCHIALAGPEPRPAGAPAARNAPKPEASQALQQHHGSVHALASPKAASSFLGILLGLKGGGGMLFIVKSHEGIPAVLNNTLMFH